MYQLKDISPELKCGDHLFKAYLTDGFYNLRLRARNSIKLASDMSARI